MQGLAVDAQLTGSDRYVAACVFQGHVDDILRKGQPALCECFVESGVPFYIGQSQHAYWKSTQPILDVIEGSGGTFSLEGNTGKAFHTRSRLFTDQEWAEIEPQVLKDLGSL